MADMCVNVCQIFKCAINCEGDLKTVVLSLIFTRYINRLVILWNNSSIFFCICFDLQAGYQSNHPSGPVILCNSCDVWNELDFQFCKCCGTQRGADQGKELDRNLKDNSLLISINARMKYLDNLLDSSKYSKQKCALKAELETFLGRLLPQKSLRRCKEVFNF